MNEHRRATSDGEVLAKDRSAWLQQALGLPAPATPFPWQEELLARFASGRIERALDIPTGLGKTAVMAIWLVARACRAGLPRRLVYLVDRRAVVDQATEVAIRLRDWVDGDPMVKEALGLGGRSLPISTLRGQHVDNREWLDDPASPAIIIGTVDMIGSRLLFEGYGTSRKMRPYHAGLLGADALVVLDEAHLVPPFEILLETIVKKPLLFGPTDTTHVNIIPPFKILSLSATGRDLSANTFGLHAADWKHETVRRRLNAPKRLVMRALDDGEKLEDALANHAWTLTGNGSYPVRCIVFSNKREVAVATKKAIEKRAKVNKKLGIAAVQVDTELFVGGRRVFEREASARRLAKLGFIAGSGVERTRAAFLIATSAGEVGVDLDADHMVCDLVSWERMVQRLGRVNRRGDGAADVVVIVEPEPKPGTEVTTALAKASSDRSKGEAKKVATYRASIERAQALRMPFDYLPQESGRVDASTGALHALKSSARGNPALQALLGAATTPAPLHPGLTRALVDAWSMTSLKDHTGRPEVDPWLRGWTSDPPQTAIVWRKYLPVRCGEPPVRREEIEAFFEAAPPNASERLETETFRAIKWLTTRAKALMKIASGSKWTAADTGDEVPVHVHDVVATVLTRAGDLRRAMKLDDLVPNSEENTALKKWKDALKRDLAEATLVVDARMGGLLDGLLDEKIAGPTRTADDGQAWILDGGTIDATRATPTSPPAVRFRVRAVETGAPPSPDLHWRERLRFATGLSEDSETRGWLVVEKWRYDAATEEDRSAGRPQRLEEHLACAEVHARDLAHRLGLPGDYEDMLAAAARLHDLGKAAKRWQLAFNAADDAVYAKTRGPLNIALLDGYRHEFGSLPFAETDSGLRQLPTDLQELALHLIAAHHGFARPVIGLNGCEDSPPSALEDRAREVAMRFARLQRRWGPWGLAWWEAILRAADQQASRENDALD